MSKSKIELKKRLDLKKRKIRAFFLSIETKRKHKVEVDRAAEELYQDGMVYIQMKLPVENITNEFEKKLKEKIEHNIIKAKIREATKTDLDSLKYIYNRAWLTSNTPFRPITKTDLQKILEYSETVFLIAKVYGSDAAFLLLDFEGENKEFAVIAALAVIPRFQRKGLGSVLGMASWQYLKEKYSNVKEIRCEVYKDNNVSYSFIKGIGFVEYDKKVYKKEDFEISDN
ncbi:MAG: GNAT family N-acetyltransferase [Candidatus Lokiarchaeota archaeon]|nr:GNAT family N-acetyltransferase [Candidatus Lokiarchaeota archaeon]MCK4479547.1 GNAT family N-acetyltransferase [Candidatus Lokiarchaeota archaeon]